ncbi:50S ribosomal protein L1 [Arenimonas fontis]|uniref:Large ribosomal subunit protein uL1 n=1 Tax=Arenimonas fontis TaxID=2608255 RepID=A0A5B2Z6E4_9GAMM|nr:50S ribosomal protein L1 [Arenimonas fontis]KAA2283457.1 50S ribosomal protein L1 [Arenimonas fontis]
MAKLSKRYKAARAQVVPGKAYPIDEALKIIKDNARSKFVESVDVAVRLGVDAKKSDQQVRGSTVLPAGTGKSVRVAVFCPPGAKADEALAAGADVVGMDDLAEKMQGGDLNYDVVIATPDAMRVVGKLGTVLGPRGLMPNPKVGTVSPNPAEAVRNAKAGQVRYRTDKAGIIHCTIGKADFDPESLKTNLQALLNDLVKAKPAAAKGQYLQKISLSSTMGVGVIVDQSSLSLAK